MPVHQNRLPNAQHQLHLNNGRGRATLHIRNLPINLENNDLLTNHEKAALALLINLAPINHVKAALDPLMQVVPVAIDDPLQERPLVTDKQLPEDPDLPIQEHALLLAVLALDQGQDLDSDDHLLCQSLRHGALQDYLKNLEMMKNPALRMFAMLKEIKSRKFIAPSTHEINKVSGVEKMKYGVLEKDVKCVPLLVKKLLSVLKI